MRLQSQAVEKQPRARPEKLPAGAVCNASTRKAGMPRFSHEEAANGLQMGQNPDADPLLVASISADMSQDQTFKAEGNFKQDKGLALNGGPAGNHPDARKMFCNSLLSNLRRAFSHEHTLHSLLIVIMFLIQIGVPRGDASSDSSYQ